MKLLIVFIMALACAQAIFPELFKEFSEKYDEDFYKIPKLFPKSLLFEKLMNLENLKEKKVPAPALAAHEFERMLLRMLDEKPKAKLVYEKLAEFQPGPSPTCSCKPATDCEYFS